MHNDLIWVYLVLCGTEGTQTLYCSLYCAQCCGETEEILVRGLALNATLQERIMFFVNDIQYS